MLNLFWREVIILRNYGRNEGRILATTYPELAEQWNYEKNGALTPRDVTIGYSSKVWWTCPLGHEWETTVNNRVSSSTGCPYCAGRKVWPGFNDLASKRPDIAAEWNTEKNGDLTPRMVTTGTKRKVWWTCPLGHEYETYIRARTNGGGCPYCAHYKVLKGFNDLATTNPEKAAEWDYGKNGELTPADVLENTNKKVWWICRKGHPSFAMSIHNKKVGRGCPLCMAEATGERFSKPVIQYSLDGEQLRTYKSGRAAARGENLSFSAVQAACIGDCKTSGGYVFRYRDQPPGENPPVPDEEKLRDVLNQVISVGDKVMFIYQNEKKAPRIAGGTVKVLTGKGVWIQTESGENRRVFASRVDPIFVPKVLVMHSRPEREIEGALDATGYPVREGDPVVYMALLLSNKCKGFEFGTVKKTGGKLWEVNRTRRASDRMIVVNW